VNYLINNSIHFANIKKLRTLEIHRFLILSADYFMISSHYNTLAETWQVRLDLSHDDKYDNTVLLVRG